MRRVPAARVVKRAPGAPLASTRLLRALVQALFEHLPGAISGDEEAVHQLRVSGRRLRVALGVLPDRPRGARARRAGRGLQELVRAAAPGRDQDVMLALLQKHLRTAGRATAWQRNLLRRLRDAQRRSRQRLSDNLLDLDLAALRRRLRELVARGGADTPDCLERTRAALERERVDLSSRLTELQDEYEPEALHALRTAFRRVRYTAELLQSLVGGEPVDLLALRGQQQQLGQIHDAWVLACWLRAKAGLGEAGLAPEAARLADTIERQARERHAEWWRGEPVLLVESLRLAHRAGDETAPEEE